MTNNPQENNYKSKIINIIAKLDNGSHSSNQLQGIDEALTELFTAQFQSIITEVEQSKIISDFPLNPFESSYNKGIDTSLTIIKSKMEK